jgi:5-formyltetrahydrofolate cyclo-ligase
MRQRRRDVPGDARGRLAASVAQRVVELIADPAEVCCYVGVRHELETMGLMEALWEAGHQVSVPFIDGEGVMVAKRLDALVDLVDGSWGIPTSRGELVAPHVVICPGLAFDASGARLGYGVGYYDRFLANRPLVTIGICYDEQLIEEVPTEPHDIRMDWVVTPSKGTQSA